jgi:hypothetical protein
MTFKLWDRWAPVLGILTVVCWVLAFVLGGSNPSTDDSDSKITSYYLSHSHQTKQIAAFFIFMAGVLLFLGFLAALRRRLSDAEGAGGSLAPLAFLRTDVLPRWFGWLGLLVGLILLFAVFFLPAFVYAGWIVLASGLLTWLPARAASTAVPQAT